VKAGPAQREREPWRGKNPGELRARFQSKPLDRVADSGAEQKPWRRCERQEGSGAGNGVRLRERKKALEGVTPRADPA